MVKKQKKNKQQQQGVFLHILHGQLSGTHCLISLLKANKDDFCFIFSGTIFQIFGPKYDMVSCPFQTAFADS